MRTQIKSLLLVALLAVMALPAWGQASTQGTEFWVSSTLACSPDKITAEPYIAISAEEACTITITGGVGNAINITQQVAAGSWNEFGNSKKAYNTNPATGSINVQMDVTKWYPVALKDANNLSTLAGVTRDYGLHITSSNGKKISVYVILSSQYSMDASNILPITALGAEYYTQDYWADERDGDFPNTLGITTILATQNNTRVQISPKGTTYNNQSTPFVITLNQGQVYYLATQKKSQLAGTHIVSLDGKPIAVFCGNPLTNLPSGLAARDCLFEQSMPIEYWGTQFIATRSLEKDGNLIGITATQRTEIKIDGYSQAYIEGGETYYIMLQGPANPSGRDAGTRTPDLLITADAVYIETSCPCAVYNYDTGNGYKGSSGSEIIVDKHGDPSSVWLSPIQQKIGKITFGTCYTNDTKDHFLNVVTETATCQQTKLTAMYGASTIDKSNLLIWTQVPGNPTLSYARAKIGDSSTQNYSVFALENPKGVIATVYGNGKNESYAYSAGSAAVEQGVMVSGETFTNGYRSDNKFCLNTALDFNAKVGTDEITRVDWDFGDGTTENYGQPQTTHTYTSPGWYDVTAQLFGHQACATEENVDLGAVHFSFRVVRPDTIYAMPDHHCISADSIYNGNKLTAIEVAELLAHGANDTTQVDCASDVVITPVSFGIDKIEKLDTIVGQDQAIGYNGQTYYASTDVVDSIFPPANSKKCLTVRQYHVKVITCLDINVVNDSVAQHICPLEDMTIGYTKTKGDILSARFVVPGVLDEEVTISNANTLMGSVELPSASIRQPGLYKGQLIIEDMYTDCGPKVFPIDLAVYYPSDIFRYKFNNVLAVYNSGYGGNTGYDFKAYQWYLNYQPIEGANEPVLYLGDGITFTIGDVVYVELTNLSGVTIPSCPQTIYTVPDYTVPDYDNAPARKVIKSQRMYILRDGQVFDIYGQRVQ